jgi:hypothetical protein
MTAIHMPSNIPYADISIPLYPQATPTLMLEAEKVVALAVIACNTRAMTTAPQVIPGLNNLSARATADIESIVRKAYEMGREDMRRELMALLSPSARDGVEATTPTSYGYDAAVARAPAKAPPGTVRPAIVKMIELSSGVSTEQILAATGFKENSVRGTLSTLHKEGKIERNAQGYWIKKLEASAEQLSEAS